MDTLSLRLKDTREAGVCRLDCRSDELYAAVTEAGKENFIAVIARAVHAPDWFGGNWDALADLLGDLSWQPAMGYVLLLRHGNDTFGMDVGDYDLAMDVFADTTAFWRSQNKPFWIFFC
jgi:hypothetical protein